MREARFRTLRMLLALVSLLLLTGGRAASAKERPWIELQSRNFLVVSNEEQEEAVALPRDLELFRSVVLEITNTQVGTSEKARRLLDEVMKWSQDDDEIEAARELLAGLDAPGPAEPAASADAALLR